MKLSDRTGQDVPVWIDERIRAMELAWEPWLLALALGGTVLGVAILLGVLCASEPGVYYGRP